MAMRPRKYKDFSRFVRNFARKNDLIVDDYTRKNGGSHEVWTLKNPEDQKTVMKLVVVKGKEISPGVFRSIIRALVAAAAAAAAGSKAHDKIVSFIDSVERWLS